MTVSDGEGGELRLDRASLLRGDGADPIPTPCPRERSDELGVVRAWFRAQPPRVLACDRAPAEPIAGGRTIARVLARTRTAEERRS